MIISRKINLGKKSLQAHLIKLSPKNLIVIRGTKGYVMCGYLNMAAANKFRDVAIKIVGISSIKQALETKAYSVSKAAKDKGIFKGQAIKDILKIII